METGSVGNVASCHEIIGTWRTNIQHAASLIVACNGRWCSWSAFVLNLLQQETRDGFQGQHTSLKHCTKKARSCGASLNWEHQGLSGSLQCASSSCLMQRAAGATKRGSQNEPDEHHRSFVRLHHNPPQKVRNRAFSPRSAWMTMKRDFVPGNYILYYLHGRYPRPVSCLLPRRYSIYHDNIVVIDPSGVQLTGLDSYTSSIKFLQTFCKFWFQERSGLQFRMVYDFARSSIRISWHPILVPKVPLGRPLTLWTMIDYFSLLLWSVFLVLYSYRGVFYFVFRLLSPTIREKTKETKGSILIGPLY